jgi:mono/diheme cytochrome c family protein
MKLRIATAVVASIAMLAGIPALAQDGATLFKTKCAMCHGDQGQGKPAMNAPKLVGTTKSVVDVLTKGGEAKAPHIKAMSTVTADQAAALAAYVKTLK